MIILLYVFHLYKGIATETEKYQKYNNTTLRHNKIHKPTPTYTHKSWKSMSIAIDFGDGLRVPLKTIIEHKGIPNLRKHYSNFKFYSEPTKFK